MKVSILWQGKPISNMKTFGKLNCTLCMRERMELLKAKNLDKMRKNKYLINSSTEVYGACRHKPKFHRFAISKTSSTDEGLTLSPKRSANGSSLDSPFLSSDSDYNSSPRCVPCVPTSPLVEKCNDLFVVAL